VQPVKDIVQHGTLEHAHDAEVVLLAHPHNKLLVARHIAASAIWPVRRDPGSRQVRVSCHILEHDVRLDQLVVLGIINEVRMARGQRVIPTTILRHRLELVKRLAHLGFHVDPVLLAHGPWQWKVGKVTANTNPHRERREAELGQIELAIGRQALDTREVPVGGVLGIL